MKFHIYQWLVVLVDSRLLYIRDHIHPFEHLAEHSVLTVEPWAWHRANVKLRSVRIFAAVSHRESAWLGMSHRRSDLVLEFTSPDRLPSRAVSLWASRLYHEAFDHPVEDHVAIVAILCMSCEVLYRFGALSRIQLAVDFTLRRVDDYLAQQGWFLLLLLLTLLRSLLV